MLIISIPDLTKMTTFDHKVTWFTRRGLPSIFKSCSLMLKTKKHSLCKYMKLEEIEEGLEVAIFPDLTLDEKNFAFMLLGSFLSSNRLQVVGINITVCVNPAAEKYLGKRYLEKVIFPKPVLFHNFSPDKESAKIDVPFKQCKNLLWAQSLDLISTVADYFPVVIPVENIYSLIVD